MTDKRCPDCKFSTNIEPKGPLKCTRNPPSVTAFLVPSRLQGQSQIVEHSAFPLATTPCGEFAGKMIGEDVRRTTALPSFTKKLYSDDGPRVDHFKTTPEPPPVASAD